MENVTIYHNPNCGTSRNTLALLRHAGLDPELIYYLDTPPTREQLEELLATMGMTPRELLRTNVAPYEDLQLDNPRLSDDALLDAMLAEPILINRPIVVTSLGTKLCRPSELVLDILPVDLPSPFTKEDGELVLPKGS